MGCRSFLVYALIASITHYLQSMENNNRNQQVMKLSTACIFSLTKYYNAQKENQLIPHTVYNVIEHALLLIAMDKTIKDMSMKDQIEIIKIGKLFDCKKELVHLREQLKESAIKSNTIKDKISFFETVPTIRGHFNQ